MIITPEAFVPLLDGFLVVLGVPDQPVQVGLGQGLRLTALASHFSHKRDSVTMFVCVIHCQCVTDDVWSML